ncbi:hypothetical protein GWI33_022810 [Rhynchophorus ferrugineus]|uniref:Transmembrane protein 192 n=1 Tax=Rhynchophorus ferrugineus TaxID=354439 RepID=A0A834MHP0_RHYFE|nr:hypothetical protein GWI33_022810 [Rhynchophorus ferrugineus]
MVSLSRSINTNAGGATFFSESVNMEDREQLLPILDSCGSFKPLYTHKLYSIHLLFTFILDVVAIVYAIRHPDKHSKCKEYFLILYLHVAYWFITYILERIVKYCHHKIQLNGYFEFHNLTKRHTNTPVFIVTLSTVILLLTQTLMQYYYPDNFANKCINGGAFSPIFNICAIVLVESCIIAGVNISYIVKVMNFNKIQAPPDVQKEEWLRSANPETFTQTEIGYKEMAGKVYDFLERQAELITFLKEQNSILAEKNTCLDMSKRGFFSSFNNT